MNTFPTVWRIHLQAHGNNVFDFCSSKSVVGFGYPLYDENGSKLIPQNIEHAMSLGKQQYPDKEGFIHSMRAFQAIKLNDLIWTLSEGKYYICRVTGTWRYQADLDNISADIVNVIPVEFLYAGIGDQIPEKVKKSFVIGGNTIRRINGSDDNSSCFNPIIVDSMKIYNTIVESVE